MSDTRLEVLLTPADFETLLRRDLSGATCVVFDVLRATTSMIGALAQGAELIRPVDTIEEAVAWRQRDPTVLLAGEREGLRITAAQSGGVEFDCGNSPREFTAACVARRSIVMTTTNGTRAIRACHGARRTLVAAWLNLAATVRDLTQPHPPHLIVVGSGTFEEAAFEDTLAAGALCERLWPAYEAGHVSDAALMARELFRAWSGDLPGALRLARNGRRLLARPELREDVAFSLRADSCDLVAVLGADGSVRRAPTRS